MAFPSGRRSQHKGALQFAMNIKELYWAAGFIEGEGSFKFQKPSGLQITAVQVQEQPLLRLQAVLGGTITGPHSPRDPKHASQYHWQASSVRAAGMMMTLFSLLSPRRKAQVREALAGWKTTAIHNKYKVNCKNGHPLNEGKQLHEANGKTRRRCTACARVANRKYMRERRMATCKQ